MLPDNLLINFVGNKAYLCRERGLPLEELDEVFNGKRFEKPASWLVEVIKHSDDGSELFVKILEYRCHPTRLPDSQVEIAAVLSAIGSIRFKSIDTAGLYLTLSGKNPGKVIRPSDKKLPWQEESEASYPEELPTGTSAGINDEHSIEDNQVRIFRDEFKVPFKKVNIGFGHVWIKWKLHPFKALQEIRIINEDLREEFDAVKNYFAKKLEVSEIVIRTEMHLKEGVIVELNAVSPEIEKINQELIESVRFELVQDGMRKKIGVAVDKSLFNADEYFDRFGLNQQGFNAFFQEEGNLMDDILKISQTKHYRNLRYLSDKHAHHILKLRFVLKPFSFIFLLEGDHKYHIVWETLNTAEATYVWPVAKDIGALRLTLRKIEEIIQVVKVQGKTAYINTSQESFQRIYHDYSNLNDGFIRWKGELESMLY